MASSFQDRLADLQRELARQDAEWVTTKQQLRAAGDYHLVIPAAALESLDEATIAPHPEMPRSYLVRG
jgi:hypothetical protein